MSVNVRCAGALTDPATGERNDPCGWTGIRMQGQQVYGPDGMCWEAEMEPCPRCGSQVELIQPADAPADTAAWEATELATQELATQLDAAARRITELEQRVTELERRLSIYALHETLPRIQQALSRLQRDLRSLRDTTGGSKDKPGEHEAGRP